MPKALVDTGSGPWVVRALSCLDGCDPRLVVIGAGAELVAALLPDDVLVVTNQHHERGMGSSLRCGLLALMELDSRADRAGHIDPDPDPDPDVNSDPDLDSASDPAGRSADEPAGDLAGCGRVDAALVMLVDLPGVGPEVIRRVARAAGDADAAPGAVLRAAFAGVPGHPVLLGRDHWPGVIGSARGDIGARAYLAGHPPILVECGDIGSGRGVDTPDP